MLARCRWTVCSLSTSRWAMPVFLNPCATSLSTSSSRGVSIVPAAPGTAPSGSLTSAPAPPAAAAGQGQAEQRVGGGRSHPRAPGHVERFREQGLGRPQRPAEVLGQAQVEGRDDSVVAVVERAEDVERFGQVAAGGVQVARCQLVVAEVAEHLPHLEPVTDLAVEPQRLGRIAGPARRIPRNQRGGDGRFHDGLLMDLLRDELTEDRP